MGEVVTLSDLANRYNVEIQVRHRCEEYLYEIRVRKGDFEVRDAFADDRVDEIEERIESMIRALYRQIESYVPFTMKEKVKK